MNLGLALRSTVFSPLEAIRVAQELPTFSYFFVPDVSNNIDPIAMALSILIKRDDCHAGTGVIRIFEHQLNNISKQTTTIQELTGNRFFLGIGTGSAEGNSFDIIKRFTETIKLLHSSNNGLEIYAAALREKMAKAVSEVADGMIINFSTFSHAKRMANAFKNVGGKKVFSYLKVFISWNKERAQAMAVEEILRYSLMPHYAALFEKEKIMNEINGVKENYNAIRKLQEKGVLLVNPTESEIKFAITVFLKNGVDVPVIYPYFSTNYSTQEKLEQIKKLFS
jgi:alkanesulfonate monooxygenase SsuD/methylene tetrahydromethanopterin reductase-like flavin-dependent oxidoreductase (luciferase family)